MAGKTPVGKWVSSDSLATGSNHVVSATPCVFKGVMIVGDGTNLGTAIVYDSASAASGTVIAMANSKIESNSCMVPGPHGVSCVNGIVCTVGGTTSKALVYYRAS